MEKASDLPHAGCHGYNLGECINMCCSALITQNPRGFMRLLIFLFYSGKGSAVVQCVLGRHTHTHTAVTERSLFLIQLLVRRGSCISSPAAIPVNLQQPPQRGRENDPSGRASDLSTATFSRSRSSAVKPQLLALRGPPAPRCCYLAFQQMTWWDWTQGGGGWGAVLTAYIPVC